MPVRPRAWAGGGGAAGREQEYILQLSKRTEDNETEIGMLRTKAGLPARNPEKLGTLALAAGAVAAATASPAAGIRSSAVSVRNAAGGAVTIKHEDLDALQQEHAELKTKLDLLERQLKVTQNRSVKVASPLPAVVPTSPSAPALASSLGVATLPAPLLAAAAAAAAVTPLHSLAPLKGGVASPVSAAASFATTSPPVCGRVVGWVHWGDARPRPRAGDVALTRPLPSPRVGVDGRWWWWWWGGVRGGVVGGQVCGYR